jgi:hypothetical protein
MKIEWLRWVPRQLRTVSLCRRLIRLNILNLRWAPESLFNDQLFSQWAGFHLGHHEFRPATLPKGIDYSRFNYRFDVLTKKVDFKKYTGMLSSEWMDSAVASEMLLICEVAYTALNPAFFSPDSIAKRIVDYPLSASEFLDYMGKVDWTAVIKCGAMIISRIPRDHFEKIDLEKLLRECPAAMQELDSLQINQRVISIAIGIFGFTGLSKKILMHEDFLPTFMSLNPDFGSEGDAAEFVAKSLLLKTKGLIVDVTHAFFMLYGDMVRERIPSIVHEAVCMTIECFRQGSSAEWSLEALAIWVLKTENRKNNDYALVNMLTGEGATDIALPLLPKLFFNGVIFEQIVPHLGSREEWLAVFLLYPREDIVKHASGRRYLLELEMGL